MSLSDSEAAHRPLVQPSNDRRGRERDSLDHVVEGATLSDSDEGGLVVCRRVDRRHAVHTSGETARNLSGESAVVGLVVEALEEDELLRVERLLLVEALEAFDGDVRVALDEALSVHLLGRHVERRGRVGEVAELHVADRDGDGERLAGGDRRAVRRVHELGRRHLVLCGDHAHRGLVARTLDDLLAVRLGLVGELEAEVDEVVRRRDRRLLASVRAAKRIDEYDIQLNTHSETYFALPSLA